MYVCKQHNTAADITKSELASHSRVIHKFQGSSISFNTIALSWINVLGKVPLSGGSQVRIVICGRIFHCTLAEAYILSGKIPIVLHNGPCYDAVI